MMNSEIGFGRKVLQAFEENGISFEHVPSGIDTMTVFVHQDEFMHKEQKVVAGIHRLANPDMIDIESDLALIAVVGRGMKSTRGTAGRIFSALAHKNINVKMIDQGSSELNIIIGVANDDFETAIKAIYDIFVITDYKMIRYKKGRSLRPVFLYLRILDHVQDRRPHYVLISFENLLRRHILGRREPKLQDLDQ